MSRTSFKVFCVEFYAKHVGRTGPEVYAEFERLGPFVWVPIRFGLLHPGQL